MVRLPNRDVGRDDLGLASQERHRRAMRRREVNFATLRLDRYIERGVRTAPKIESAPAFLPTTTKLSSRRSGVRLAHDVEPSTGLGVPQFDDV